MVAAVSLQASAKRRPWGDMYPVKSGYSMAFPELDFFASPRKADLCAFEDSRSAGCKNFGFELSDDYFGFSTEKPLPPGWEQCLDLKTGKMYYLNRLSGVQTSCDPRSKSISPETLLKKSFPLSPSTSDLTVEANQVIKGRSITLAELNELNTHRASETTDSNSLDLTLSLRPSKPLPAKESLHHQHIQPHQLGKHSTDKECLHPQHIQPHQLGKQHTDIYSQIQDRISSFAKTETSQFSWKQSKPAMRTSSNNCMLNSPLKTVESKPINNNEKLSNSNFRAAVPLLDLENILNQNVQRSSSVLGGSRLNDVSVDGDDAMVTVGCSKCMMYVMVSQKSNQRCPKCGSPFISSNPPEQSPPKRARIELSLMH